MSDVSANSLQPGRDYYVEDGCYVFTAAYLLARGTCCGSGCRHCPWPAQNITNSAQCSAEQQGDVASQGGSQRGGGQVAKIPPP